MKAERDFICTTRRSEYSASLAVTGLPEANFRPGRILKVWVLPSGDAVQLSASTPMILLESSVAAVRSGW
ncbi:hypothetical protein D3C78_1875760 [compost metagenome]